MDETQTTAQTPPTPTTQPAPQGIPPQQPQKNNAMLYVIMLIVLVVIGGMLYFIISRNDVKTQAIKQESAPTMQEDTRSEEEKEAEAIDLGEPEPSELKEVEKDVNTL
jgi:uncharacterized protein HemX